MSGRITAEGGLARLMHARVVLILIGGLLLTVGSLLSPEHLRAIGVMRRSLESEIDLVRRTALLEVHIFRVVCMLGAVGVFSLAARWRRVVRSDWFTEWSLERPTDRRGISVATLTNFSFRVMLSGIVLGLLYIAVGGWLFDSSTLEFINREDGVLETASACTFLACAVLAATVASRRRTTRERLVPALFAIGFLMFVGEEISWGQRLLSIETPGIVQGLNVQGEFNLHNLAGYAADHLFILGVFVYGGVIPLVARVSPLVDNLCRWAGIPLASPGLALGFVLVSMIHDWTVYRVLAESSLRTAELREALSALGFALLMWEALG